MDITKIGKKEINRLILPHFPKLRKPKVQLWRIVKMILYKLKTGCQWRYLPVKMFCGREIISWQTVYYHFRKWAKMKLWETVFNKLLSVHKRLLDLSSIQLDGSHTIAKRGGQAVGYQHRKKAKTTNCLFLADNGGLILAMSTPVSGNHNDLYQIEKMTLKMFNDLDANTLKLDGLFLNADAGFDSHAFRNFCHGKGIITNFAVNKRNSKNTVNQYFMDDELYRNRFVIERSNAWIDSFKALLIRFETLQETWIALHYLAFCSLFINRLL